MAFLDETGLAELWALVREADVKIVTGTYTGTGSATRTLTFDTQPKWVLINNGASFAIIQAWAANDTESTSISSAYYSGYYSWYVTYSDGTLKWLIKSGTSYHGRVFNESGTTYYYMAII